jgi:uncharacterized protein (TIGR00299 family) protein
MKIAHFDCFSGISGDMTLGALIDLGIEAGAIQQAISRLNLPVELKPEKVRKAGFAATRVHVRSSIQHEHRHWSDIKEILERGGLTERQYVLASRIFQRLAEAEAKVHGLSIDKVHFHEVGALDSIADIVGSAVGLDLLEVDRFTSRSVPTGHGMVRCDHGLMPVPTPGTAELLKGVPLAHSSIEGELTTPTGAAILTSVVTDWIEQPSMTIERIGHGAGSRDLPGQPNLLRLIVGQVDHRADSDHVWMLETNLDDLAGETIGYCYEVLLAAGALDVYCTSIFMKKNRPGVILSVLTPDNVLHTIEEILFRETGTFGLRRYRVERTKLHRRSCVVHTPWGPLQGKLGWLEGRPPVFSPEYEDCARIARDKRVALRDVYEAARHAYDNQGT